MRGHSSRGQACKGAVYHGPPIGSGVPSSLRQQADLSVKHVLDGAVGVLLIADTDEEGVDRSSNRGQSAVGSDRGQFGECVIM